MPDFLACVGFAMIGAGLWMVSPPMSLVVCGSLLIIAAWSIAAGLRTKTRKGRA